jgi:beta-galactosidase
MTIPPAILRYDYWIYSGVHRDVYLDWSSGIKVYDIFVRGRPVDSQGEVEFEESILNTNAQAAKVCAEAVIRPKGETGIAATGKQILEVQAGMIVRTTLTLHISNPRLWSPESPNLYTAMLSLTKTDESSAASAEETITYNPNVELPPHASLTPLETEGIDAAETDFGIRSIEVSGDKIYLNGEQVIFKGINRHDEYPMLGRTITEDMCRNDLMMMKRANMNTLRTAHYPNDPKIYRLADELGLLVFEEIPATGLRPWEMCSGNTQGRS